MLEYILHDGWWLSVSHVDYLMHRNGDFIFGFPKLLFSWKKCLRLIYRELFIFSARLTVKDVWILRGFSSMNDEPYFKSQTKLHCDIMSWGTKFSCNPSDLGHRFSWVLIFRKKNQWSSLKVMPLAKFEQFPVCLTTLAGSHERVQ